jgi:hypothetical protein
MCSLQKNYKISIKYFLYFYLPYILNLVKVEFYKVWPKMYHWIYTSWIQISYNMKMQFMMILKIRIFLK